jgi:hypothetical protein
MALLKSAGVRLPLLSIVGRNFVDQAQSFSAGARQKPRRGVDFAARGSLSEMIRRF